MPLIEQSSYRAPLFFTNPHIQTVFPTIFRRVRGVSYKRQRIDTRDGDFIDIDWSTTGKRLVAIVLHGLEGNSTRSYMLGMVRALNRSGWDAVAMNFRCCSGEPNRTMRLYHSGDTEDIHDVVSFIAGLSAYEVICLVGFSLGGNVILKYLGEESENINSAIKAAAVISVPCDLKGCSERLAESGNRMYSKRFLTLLHEKIAVKARKFPEQITLRGYESIKTLKEFDDRYTAPIHGFQDAEDYYRKSSSKPLLPRVSVPTLLINAADDPFLSQSCFPKTEAAKSEWLHLEIPKNGGHCGFMSFGTSGFYWTEQRVSEFFQHVLNRHSNNSLFSH